MTVCSSQSEEQPGFVTLWFATYHSYTETDRTSVLKVVDPESGAHLSTTDFQSCRATNNNRNVDDISDVLQSSCSHISLYLDGGYRQAFPNNSSVVCYQSGTTPLLGEMRVGHDSLEVCYPGSGFSSWHAAIVKADNVGVHEVWIDGSPSNGAAPLGATWNSHESHMPCAMSSSVHWNLPFADLNTRCSSPPAHLLDHVLPGYDCNNSYVGQLCSVECEPGYATQGFLQCQSSNSTNATGEGEWSSSFACVPYASDVPNTRAPGVNYVCEEHNDLGDNTTGNVSFQNYDSYHTECWHIECDKDVVISFSAMQLYTYSYLDLYTSGNDSGNGTDFTLEKRFNYYDTPMDVVLNGSAFVQFRSTYYTGWSRLEFDYVCVDATTQAPPTDVPNTRAPGVNYVCEEHNDLGDNTTGNVSFQNYDSYHTECWHIECDKDVVISFSTMQLYTYSYLDLYTSGNDSGNGTDFTLEKRFNNYDTPMDVVLNGSAFVQFRSTYYSGWSRLEFDYVCVDATTQAPPTDAPDTRAPGVDYVCEEHNDLGDNATGNVSFQNYDSYHTECWHIECDKDVVISFSTMQLYYSSYLDLYTSGNDSGNGTDFTLEKRFNYYDTPMDVVLNGSAFVQFRSTYYTGWSRLEFDYVCVDATTQAPPTDAPDTRAPGVNYVCEGHSDRTGTGYVNYENYNSSHTQCWHIECDYDVVLKFSDIQLYYYAHVSIYSGTGSGNDTNFNLEHDWYSYTTGFEGVELVVSGSAFVQFRSTYYYGRSYLAFQYECRAPTPPPQQQCGVDTVPQRCGQGTSRACAFEVRHPARLLSVAFSWDGRRVATGSADRFVRVFDARTGVRVGQLGCADGFRVHDIAFSPDNNLVALAGEGGRVVVCNAATGVLEATLVDMSASGSTPVHRVEFTRDGRYVVSGGGHDARTRVFDMLASDRTKASSVINHHARNVGFSVDGAHLATVRGSEVDEVTTVWGLDGTSAVTLPSVAARVTALSFSSFGGNALLRGMSDGTILVSQLPGSSIGDGSAVDGVSLSMLSGAVHDSKFSRDGKMIAAVGEGDVMVWSHDGSVLHELLGHSQAVLPRLDFSPDGTRLATVSRDGTLVVWKL